MSTDQREIKVCPEQGAEVPREITVCPSQGGSVPREITVCPSQQDGPDCTDPTELVISGTETPTTGSSYSASGGVEPYSYSFSGGSISDSGQITSIDSCSTSGAARWATVSVTDACGQSDSMVVRLPDGTWNQVSSDLWFQSDEYCANATSTVAESCWGVANSYRGFTGYSGGYKYEEYYRLKLYLYDGELDCMSTDMGPSSGVAFSGITCQYGSYTVKAFMITRYIYEWVCP